MVSEFVEQERDKAEADHLRDEMGPVEAERPGDCLAGIGQILTETRENNVIHKIADKARRRPPPRR
jgi:hypothetical protein